MLGRSNANDLAAVVARFRAKIDNPVRRFNHFEIVLDDDERMARINKPLKNLQQHRDVVEMKTSRRLVEDEEISTLAVFTILSGFRFPVSGFA